MARVSLRRLVLFNFRSFCGRHELKFVDKGLVILRGNNRDTKGDSGAGKTNVLRAIAYLFDFCKLPARVLQCKFDDKPMYIEGYLDVDGEEVVVHRGIKGLKIGKLKGKAAEERLTQICGVSSVLREALTYRDQLKPQRFLDMQDRQLKEFLFQVLQLQGLERKIKEAEERVKELAPKVGEAMGVLEQTSKTLTQEEARVQPFAPAPTADLEAALMDAEREREAIGVQLEAARVQLVKVDAEESVQLGLLAQEWKLKIKRLKETPLPGPNTPKERELRAKLGECDRWLEHFQKADVSARAAYEAESADLRAQARKLHNELAKLPELIDRASHLREEASKLQADVCAMCDRVWDNAQQKLVETERQIKEVEASIETIRAHHEAAESLDATIAARHYQSDTRLERFKNARVVIQQQLGEIVTEYLNRRAVAQAELDGKVALAESEAQSARARYLTNYDRPVAKLQALTNSIRGEYSAASAKVNELQHKLDLIKQDNHFGREAHAVAVERLASAEKADSDAKLNAVAATQEWRKETDYAELLKGFRNKVFDETLLAIGTEATAIVGMLPNAQHISIDFKHDDSTYERILPVTYLYGEECGLEEYVNGGAITSVHLAVDLAVGRVVSRRLGCNLNWVILDEAFNGHDHITKGGCLEMLQQFAADKLVIIVDHTSEIKEMFTQDIVVEFENKRSRFA